MKSIIVGTAGHIDHGKTSLVGALTGIDTDRLAEEKRRGITIDLGFAHLQLTPELRLGFVDVPGHERFVKNMLAGACGIDLLLFVVAADESVKPQTREHFDICRLLGVRSGVIALTKTDIADPEIAELTRLEVEELVAGTFLESAAIIPVSAVTGAGLPELRQALAKAASAIPAKDAAGYFRLPVDRAFSMRGFGTVVTGTLAAGSVARDGQVELQPSGRLLRVRGVQVHGQPAERAIAGQRTALNLADIEASELSRGMVLTEPGRFRPARSFDCRLQLLPSARPLRHGAPVHFHAGTAEVEAEVRLFPPARMLRPGAEAFVRILLREEQMLWPRQRFILRQFSPVITIAGGEILEANGRRYRRGESPDARLSVLGSGDWSAVLKLLVREAPLGLSLADLIARTGLTPQELAIASGSTKLRWLADGEWLTDPDQMEALRRKLLQAVSDFHSAQPLQPGLGKADAKAAIAPGAPAFFFDELIATSPELIADGTVIRRRGRQVVLQQPEEDASERIEAAFRQAGLAVPTVPEVLGASGIDAGRARAVLQILLRSGRLVRVTDTLIFHAAAIDRLKATIETRRGQSLDVAGFKEMSGISRKYAIPLLEYFDRMKITKRTGDRRIVI